mgnify:CR=1 FL=1
MTDTGKSATADLAPGRWTEVLAIFLRLGLTSFGGPIAHLGYFREEFVGKRRWRQLSLLLNGAAKIEVRFRPPASKCHDALALVRAAPRSPVAAPGPPRTPERAKLEAV